MVENSCEGCRTYKHPLTGIVDCNFEEYNVTDICPCAICIIKTMCDCPCPKYEEFRVTVLNLAGSE